MKPCARWTCSWRRSKRWRWRSRPRPAAPRSTSARSSSTPCHGRRDRPRRQGGAGGAHGGAAARRRQHGSARAHPVEARRADAGGIRTGQDPPARRRGDSAQRAVRRAGRGAGALPSRTLGRARLSRRGCAAPTFPSARASSRSPTATARCKPNVPTGRAEAPTRRSWCCATKPASRSIRIWSTS